ncbi:MAG: DUF2306 domain-containing protein [Reichenbachiella sp.]|uniref:DUF2306 domain-containing protein n=1 Tax=Reichenbachiella sp. TaxID=2184521 RepID=UPI003264984E
MKKLGWVLFGVFSLLIGVYPVVYFLIDMKQGLLGSKSEDLLQNEVWFWFFYQHIGFGAMTMLTGWTQFSRKLRVRNINIHKVLGKIYVISVLLSGTAGLYLSFYATGGLIASFGFGIMAVLWVITTFMAFITVKKGEITAHQQWMIRSYALCWAAVTLRIWLPTLQIGFGLDFISSYLIVSWLCWVPNLIVAELIILNGKSSRNTNISLSKSN